MSDQWPQLSKTLRFERHPDGCQNCGNGPATHTELHRWQECDGQDRKTPIVVVLCKRCSDRLIEPHPRLYHRLEPNAPLPGTMALCVKCRHRDGLGCRHPKLKANGGPGLNIAITPPSRGFWDGADPKTGRRTGGMFEHWPSPATACEGREEITL